MCFLVGITVVRLMPPNMPAFNLLTFHLVYQKQQWQKTHNSDLKADNTSGETGGQSQKDTSEVAAAAKNAHDDFPSKITQDNAPHTLERLAKLQMAKRIRYDEDFVRARRNVFRSRPKPYRALEKYFFVSTSDRCKF